MLIMNFKTTTEILDYSNEMLAMSTDSMGTNVMEIVSDRATKLIETINSHLETGAFTGDARQDLLTAKDNAWIVSRLMDKRVLSDDEIDSLLADLHNTPNK